MWSWEVDGAIVTSQLRLDARLEARLGLGHELRPDVVPVGVVRRRNGHGRVGEVTDLNLGLDLLLDLLARTGEGSRGTAACWWGLRGGARHGQDRLVKSARYLHEALAVKAQGGTGEQAKGRAHPTRFEGRWTNGIIEISPICNFSLPRKQGERGSAGRAQEGGGSRDAAHAFSEMAETRGWSAATRQKRRAATSWMPLVSRSACN